jgi:hypothetical protein
VLAALVEGLESFLGEAQAETLMLFELLTLAPRNPEIAGELAEHGRRTRRHLADALRAKAEAGELHLAGDPDTLATFLLVLADGIAVRRATEPGLDLAPLIAHARSAARALLA